MNNIIVVKRDGTEMPYDSNKIFHAVCKAIKEVDGDLSRGYIACNIAKSVDSYMEAHTVECIAVEEIQDLVENLLIYSGDIPEIARAYIRYRYKRELARSNYKELMDTVGEKLSAANVQNQNANVDEYSFGGRMGEMNSAVARKYALEYLVSPMARKNHEENMIYIHDLDNYAVGSHNCLTIPFDDLLAKGFNTRQTDVRPAQSVSTAFQLVAVIFQLQSLQQFGGVSASHIDWTMVPYVRKSFYKHYRDGLMYVSDDELEYKCFFISNPETVSIEETSWIGNPEHVFNAMYNDKKAYKYAMAMTEREVYQAVEAMYHNLNTLQSRSGNQLPFTSVNYGTCTLPEGRMVTKALLDVSIKGIGALHKTSVFPCGIFQCMKGVNREPGDPNYDLFKLALRSTAQRLYPNYANVDWSGNAGYDRSDPRTYFSTMGK
jgi:ribonucleoside-triphosphate reductase